tara:strand:+ start:261 stop:569 length:309 start_codon:yes stop_codon:yes gene_type:complete
MTWVYICIAIGSTGFLFYVVIEYLKASSALKPQAEYARQQIREVEVQTEMEGASVESTKAEMADLEKEVKSLAENLKKIEQESAKLKSRESRRRPTSHQVED